MGAAPVGAAWPRRSVAIVALAALLAYLALTPLPPFAADVYGSLVRRYVITGALLLGYLVWLVRGRRLPGGTPLDLPVAALVVALALALGRSADPRVGLETLLPLLPMLVLFYLIHDARVLDAPALGRAVVLAASVVALFALASVWRSWSDWLTLVRAVEGGLERATLLPPAIPRVHSVGNHPNVLGVCFAIALPVVLALWRDTRSPRGRSLVATAGIVITLALFFTLSRAAWLAAVAGVVVAAAGLLDWRSGRIALPRSTWLIVGALLALLALVLVAVWASGARPDSLFRDSLGPRADMRRVGWEILRDHPLTGIGPGLFVSVYPLYNGAYPFAAVHAHNVVVQIGSDAGLIGLAAAALLAGAVLWVVARAIRDGPAAQRHWTLAAAGMLAAFAVHGLADAPHLFPETDLLAAVALVIVLRGLRPGARTARFRRFAPLLGRVARLGPALVTALAVLLPIAWLLTSWGHAAYTEGIAAARAGRWPEAVTAARRAVERDPKMPAYWFQRGAAHASAAIDGERRLHQEESRYAYQRGLELAPHNGAAVVNYAALNIALERPELARETLPAIARLAGRDSLLLLAHATLTQWTMPPEEAIETYAGLLVLNPTLAATPFWESDPFRAASFPQIVDRAVARVPEVAGTGPAATALRNAIEVYAGRATPSTEAQLAALRARPDDVGLRVATARILMASPPTRAQALDLLQGAVRLRGDDPAARATLGDWYAQAGDLPRARHQWTAASYLGDLGATVALGNSFTRGLVPPAVVKRARQQLLSAEITRFYLLFQTYRFTFQRAEAIPIILPGDWLNALPQKFDGQRAAVEAWEER